MIKQEIIAYFGDGKIEFEHWTSYVDDIIYPANELQEYNKNIKNRIDMEIKNFEGLNLAKKTEANIINYLNNEIWEKGSHREYFRGKVTIENEMAHHEVISLNKIKITAKGMGISPYNKINFAKL